MENTKALLIIDMQKGSFTPATPRFDTDGVVSRINELASLFRTLNFPVIHIQHDGSETGEFKKNTVEWEILDEIIVGRTDIFIDKYANDAFYDSELQVKLTELNVDELYITGCATDFCVGSSVQSALTKDYNIIVVADGHTTGDRPNMSAEKVIAHYNWVWQNMTPTKGRIVMKSFDRIKGSLYYVYD